MKQDHFPFTKKTNADRKRERLKAEAVHAQRAEAINKALAGTRRFSPTAVAQLFEGAEEQTLPKCLHPFVKFVSAPEHKHLAKSLLTRLAKTAPNLVEDMPNQLEALVRIGDWVRGVDDWKPSGAGRETQFISLVKHLYVKYKVPHFMFRPFVTIEPRNHVFGKAAEGPYKDAKLANIELFKYLAQGGSMVKAVKEKKIPTPLTNKMCHLFLTVIGPQEPVHAIRHAQVRALGGTRMQATALCATRLGEGFRDPEDFWAAYIQWIVNNPMLDPRQIGPLFDYVNRKRDEDKAWSLKGRTPVSLIRDMEEWHARLAKVRVGTAAAFPLSGFLPRKYERGEDQVWTIDEILSSKELIAEGVKLQHCVYSYASSVINGQTSIWSLRCNGERLVTIEVDNKNRLIPQVRGKQNRAPSAIETQYVSQWAQDNNLKVARYVW